jgi:hypothetical protein
MQSSSSATVYAHVYQTQTPQWAVAVKLPKIYGPVSF